MNGPIQARVFNGTRDLLPEEMIPRQRMLAVMTRIFEKYGFAPVETPVMEFLEVLLGKYGEEGDKLIYPLAYKGGNVLGLRYDLTVPLSRLVAMHRDLPMPFKRYQIQPVYRADRPQPAQGRFREFYQCDVDTVGSDSLVADAENIAVCYEVYRELGLAGDDVGLIMRINNRKVLRAMVCAAGLDAEQDKVVCTALDKIDKIGEEKVEGLLVEAGIPADAIKHLFDTIKLGQKIGPTCHAELIEAVGERLGDIPEGAQALDEMRALFSHVEALGVPANLLHFDLVLTRGLDYYTGPIYEFRITKLENFGSLGGGGRYDDLMSIYGKGDIPATGVSIGLSRVLSALLKMDRLVASKTPTRVLVLRMSDVDINEQIALVSKLREGGVPTELFYADAKFKKQISHADKLGIPFVAIQGSRETAKGVVQLKDIRVGEQVEVKVEEAAAHILKHLDS
ncbi:MAG: histidyl-tRNA synthetase [Planctomycetota bacterium]|jgi:histidyl-tRNA synthetase